MPRCNGCWCNLRKEGRWICGQCWAHMPTPDKLALDEHRELMARPWTFFGYEPGVAKEMLPFVQHSWNITAGNAARNAGYEREQAERSRYSSRPMLGSTLK